MLSHVGNIMTLILVSIVNFVNINVNTNKHLLIIILYRAYVCEFVLDLLYFHL